MTPTRNFFCILRNLNKPNKPTIAIKPPVFQRRIQQRSYSTLPPQIQQPTNPPQAQNQAQNHRDGLPRMKIQFKCIAPSPTPHSDLPADPSSQSPTCGHVNSHEFSAQAFHHGIVLVQCPACSNRHLIADNLQWFTSNRTSDDPNFKNDYKTIIDIMKAKGESVRRVRLINPGSTNDNVSSNDCEQQELIHESGHVVEIYQ